MHCIEMVIFYWFGLESNSINTPILRIKIRKVNLELSVVIAFNLVIG